MLAGEPVVTPMELFIFMGGDPDQFTPEIEEHCIRDLKAHGYRLEKVAIEFYAPELQDRWVRHEHWPEDDQWPE
ncbi:hypothetical protein [Sphingosinicella humi]|nr:hypothetical protein [Sphingosinicella humi]